jgi:hypothetical protein
MHGREGRYEQHDNRESQGEPTQNGVFPHGDLLS